jgi:hypothetical protein
MKQCPFCAEDIQDAAIVCKHCGRDLKSGASQVQVVAPPKKTSPAAWGCLTVIVLFVVLVMIGQCFGPSSTRSRPTSTTSGPATPPVPSADQLALLSSTGGRSSDSFLKVEGQVKNISKDSLKSVAAVVTWYDKDGGFIASDTTLIEYDPLLPDQTSPFHVLTRANPKMEKYSIGFKRLLGGTIPTDDRRKK